MTISAHSIALQHHKRIPLHPIPLHLIASHHITWRHVMSAISEVKALRIKLPGGIRKPTLIQKRLRASGLPRCARSRGSRSCLVWFAGWCRASGGALRATCTWTQVRVRCCDVALRRVALSCDMHAWYLDPHRLNARVLRQALALSI